MTDSRSPLELHQIAEDLFAGRIYTDRHIPEHEGAHALGMVFMPLALGADLTTLGFSETNPPGMIYEYLDKAGPRSCNGMPAFFSMHVLTQTEAEEVMRLWRNMRDAIKAVV